MSGQRNETELFWSAENVINRRSTGLRTAEPKPLKRTFRSAIVISALPRKQTSAGLNGMSAYGQKRTVCRRDRSIPNVATSAVRNRH
jgi:hypothetical protein